MAFAGFAIVVLGALLGFASFTTDVPAPATPTRTYDATLPDQISGRLTAAILSSRLSAPRGVSTTTTSPAPQTTPTTAASPTSEAAPAQPELSPPTSRPPASGSPATTTTTTTRSPVTIPITQPPITFQASVEQWRPLVATYFPPSLLDPALSVMACESGGDPNAKNPNSTAGGLYQFIASTWNWASAHAGFSGVSVYDPEANIATAAFLVEYSIDRDLPPWQHWVCQPEMSP